MTLPPQPKADVAAKSNLFLAELRNPDRSRPLIIAHRGDSFHAPENTLEAARLGWEAGADAWELDVQLTRDGVPIVIHDDTLTRTTNVATRFPNDPRQATGYLVSDFDLAEIRDLDAGAWFLASGRARTAHQFGSLAQLTPSTRESCSSGQVKIPTLAEALRMTLELDWKVNVEVKSFPYSNPALLERTLAVMDSLSAGSRVLLSSFDHGDIARAARLRPDLALGALTVTPLAYPHSYVKRVLGADCYHSSLDALGFHSSAYRAQPAANHLRTEEIAQLRHEEIPILVYTVNETQPRGIAVHLAEAGISGLFTDNPRGMGRLFTAQ